MTLRSALAALALVAATLAFAPAAGAYSLCPEKYVDDLCVEGDPTCFNVVVWPSIDFGAGAGNCLDAASGPHGAGACETAWAGTGGLGGFWGVVLSLCGGLDGEGNGCVVAYVQIHEEGSTLKPVCLA